MTAYALNLLDLILTLHALNNGAVELNPVMRCVPVMIAYKVIAVGKMLAWLARQKTPLARAGLGVCAAVYAAANIWHIVNLLRR